ncbi:helicase-related protein [Mesorhizobium sp. CA8]|uniref:helicase-related protein n=1 Tax=Mesorhizobium sp. CA8 TaxID=2876637 RepID=UPI001CCE143E|nr:helicase-related protein [Mesorhizobium sp. CA8]
MLVQSGVRSLPGSAAGDLASGISNAKGETLSRPETRRLAGEKVQPAALASVPLARMSESEVARVHRKEISADMTPLNPVGAVAAMTHRRIRTCVAPILYIAQDTRRAEQLTTILKTMAGELAAAFYPRWDGSAADAIPASAEAVGRRMSVLRWLLDRDKRPRVLVSTPEALLRRVPPRDIWNNVHLEFQAGDEVVAEDVQDRLQEIGYVFDDRVDEPGEAAIRGRVIEVFPAASPRPCRIEIENSTIISIRSYDPLSQRSVAEARHLIVDPASESVPVHGTSPDGLTRPGETLFDYLDDAEVIAERGANQRGLDAISALQEDGENMSDFLSRDEWESISSKIAAEVLNDPDAKTQIPVFAREADAAGALRSFAENLIAEGLRVVLIGPAGHVLQLWRRRVERALALPLAPQDDWEAVCTAPSACLYVAPIEHGFVDREDMLLCVALRDLAGQALPVHQPRNDLSHYPDAQLRFGDVVVHFEHGIGILEGLEPAIGDDEALRLRYADDAVLLVPLREIGKLWRYGGAETEVTLDRLKGDAWRQRRDKTVARIEQTAKRMVRMLGERDLRRATPLNPDRVQFERLCAGFPYDLTLGQADASAAIATDLASGRPMNRLLCGDVGFGKTEIAVRAVAAAVFSGRQAALVAPTTVLARQHFELFRRRFRRHGIEVAMLSRLQTVSETRRTKASLAEGSVRILVATHAICAKDVRFKDLSLVVIDEEQRFGMRHKKAMRDLARGQHVLSMTATPIPRTLQAGFVGLMDLSVITTPPVRRRPIRTATVTFETEIVRKALRAEKERSGQSLIVCPRIEDLAPLSRRINDMVPELSLTVLHGDMSGAKIDRAMLDFAAGKGDILLATNIVESGLNVPGANTIIVYKPERFGLAQLHQLRGRVGRGSRRANMLMALEPGADVSEGARRRFQALEQFNALGSGFDISTRDLDIRGAGDLLGKEQAGHLYAIGLSLYRSLLERALAKVRGERTEAANRAEIDLGFTPAIPIDYIPHPELRIELAAALDRAESEVALAQTREEFSDRFGPIPSSLETGFALASLRIRATMLGISKIDGGPKGVALRLPAEHAAELQKRLKIGKNDPLRWSAHRLILDHGTDVREERLAAVESLLDRIA